MSNEIVLLRRWSLLLLLLLPAACSKAPLCPFDVDLVPSVSGAKVAMGARICVGAEKVALLVPPKKVWPRAKADETKTIELLASDAGTLPPAVLGDGEATSWSIPAIPEALTATTLVTPRPGGAVPHGQPETISLAIDRHTPLLTALKVIHASHQAGIDHLELLVGSSEAPSGLSTSMFYSITKQGSGAVPGTKGLTISVIVSFVQGGLLVVAAPEVVQKVWDTPSSESAAHPGSTEVPEKEAAPSKESSPKGSSAADACSIAYEPVMVTGSDGALPTVPRKDGVLELERLEELRATLCALTNGHFSVFVTVDVPCTTFEEVVQVALAIQPKGEPTMACEGFVHFMLGPNEHQSECPAPEGAYVPEPSSPVTKTSAAELLQHFDLDKQDLVDEDGYEHVVLVMKALPTPPVSTKSLLKALGGGE